MQEKQIIKTHERALLLETFLKRADLSESTEESISIIIRDTLRKSGSEAAESKAKEIRETLETEITEKELLKKLKMMKV